MLLSVPMVVVVVKCMLCFQGCRHADFVALRCYKKHSASRPHTHQITAPGIEQAPVESQHAGMLQFSSANAWEHAPSVSIALLL